MKDLPVVMFHSVNSDPLPHPMKKLVHRTEEFTAYLGTFQKQGYQMISMDDLLEGRYDPEKPFAVLTFDDGFRDNLTVAAPILRRFGARATVFVNPAYDSYKADERSDYGFLTKPQWKEISDTGVFDVQAHTLTHEFVFASGKIVDFYTRAKFEKYYWLAWMLYPEAVHAWDSSAVEYAEKIPEGYPIFEYTRRLSAPAFLPDPAAMQRAAEAYRAGERDEAKLSAIACEGGRMESEEEYLVIARRYLAECRSELEAVTGKTVHTVCFPGGGYTDAVLEMAKEEGYRCYMRASRLKEGNNLDHLAALKAGKFVGFNRMSFSKIRKKPIPLGKTASVVSSVTLGAYQGKPTQVFFKKILRRLG